MIGKVFLGVCVCGLVISAYALLRSAATEDIRMTFMDPADEDEKQENCMTEGEQNETGRTDI